VDNQGRGGLGNYSGYLTNWADKRQCTRNTLIRRDARTWGQAAHPLAVAASSMTTEPLAAHLAVAAEAASDSPAVLIDTDPPRSGVKGERRQHVGSSREFVRDSTQRR
jgi:hypothetical protein